MTQDDWYAHFCYHREDINKLLDAACYAWSLAPGGVRGVTFWWRGKQYSSAMSDGRVRVKDMQGHSLVQRDDPYLGPQPKPAEFSRTGIVERGKKRPMRRLHKALTPKDRFAILERDGFRCRICGASPHGDDTTIVLHVDHITPRSKGGTNDPSNLWALCYECNIGKGTQDL
jgi:hypothetical protein